MKCMPLKLMHEIYKKLDIVYTAFLNHNIKDFEKNIHVTVKYIEKICDLNTDVVLSRLLWPQKGRYSIYHSIHTAILCELLARKSGYPADRFDLTTSQNRVVPLFPPWSRVRYLPSR